MEHSGCSQEALPPAPVADLPCSDPRSGPFHTQATPWHIRELLGKGPSSGQPDTEKDGFGKWNSILGQREKGVLECSLCRGRGDMAEGDRLTFIGLGRLYNGSWKLPG